VFLLFHPSLLGGDSASEEDNASLPPSEMGEDAALLMAGGEEDMRAVTVSGIEEVGEWGVHGVGGHRLASMQLESDRFSISVDILPVLLLT
tara:strand:+ start:228 stop:500 length:273 start_codon:yes stop_codon:yes gene_type:complete